MKEQLFILLFWVSFSSSSRECSKVGFQCLDLNSASICDEINATAVVLKCPENTYCVSCDGEDPCHTPDEIEELCPETGFTCVNNSTYINCGNVNENTEPKECLASSICVDNAENPCTPVPAPKSPISSKKRIKLKSRTNSSKTRRPTRKPIKPTAFSTSKPSVASKKKKKSKKLGDSSKSSKTVANLFSDEPYLETQQMVPQEPTESNPVEPEDFVKSLLNFFKAYNIDEIVSAVMEMGIINDLFQMAVPVTEVALPVFVKGMIATLVMALVQEVIDFLT